MPYCPDCDLKEQMSRITKESLMKQVQDAGIEVDEKEFKRRLLLCDECFNFQSGIMCSMTGAYSIYVASKKNGSCPRNKW